MLRLPAADEPPAEEADEAAHDDDRGDGDPRDRAGREAAPVRAGGRAARPICTRSVPLDTLCAYLGIVCTRLAVLWRALFASVAISLSVSVDAYGTLVRCAALAASSIWAVKATCPIGVGLLTSSASRACSLVRAACFGCTCGAVCYTVSRDVTRLTRFRIRPLYEESRSACALLFRHTGGCFILGRLDYLAVIAGCTCGSLRATA